MTLSKLINSHSLEQDLVVTEMKSVKTTLSPEIMANYRRTFHRRAQVDFQAREKVRCWARQVVVEAISRVVPLYPSVRRVYLFGSITRSGAFRSDSDIDLGIEGADMGTCFQLWRDMEQTVTEWMLDVRSLDDDDPFTGRVRLKGEIVYERPITGS